MSAAGSVGRPAGWCQNSIAQENGTMRISHGHGSADEPPPTPEQVEQWHRRTFPPENELPAGVGLTVVLGRTEDAAVGITQLEAFSTGFQFTLAVRLRRARPELGSSGLWMLISPPRHRGIDTPLSNRLLLGIEYSNGQRASTLQDMRMMGPGAEVAGQELMLVEQGGGGADLSVDQRYWVAPLPPDGPMTFVLAWPGLGMPESRTVVDSVAIRAAAERSQVLWPVQPAGQDPEPPPVPRPSSGWFAEPSS
jgi:hypothetical protein